MNNTMKQTKHYWPYSLLTIVFFSAHSLFAQVGINTSTPHASSVLDMVSSTKGVLVPRMNTGERMGTEVVQLYVRDLVSSVTRPVKELKGFKKVRLGPGETITVEIPITSDALAFHDIDMNYVVEPGEFAIMVGTSSNDADLHSVMLRVEK